MGCKEVTDQRKLVRIACETTEAGQTRAVVDHLRDRPGRGAWIHNDSTCLENALKKGAFNRAFRTRVNATELTLDSLPVIKA
ncbi:YlxR family protein [Rothia aerolata]|uniref:YlxR family protein n=1 Tax=Rothia aerolata TaxID=1812262 RepID=UPI002279FA84|nr:YlxR family protein [Rothia aerolata]